MTDCLLSPLQVRFFINNDKFFKGAVIAVSAEKFRTFEKLLEHLTRIMCNQVQMNWNCLLLPLCLTFQIAPLIGYPPQRRPLHIQRRRARHRGCGWAQSRGRLRLLEHRFLQTPRLPQVGSWGRRERCQQQDAVEQDEEGDILLGYDCELRVIICFGRLQCQTKQL